LALRHPSITRWIVILATIAVSGASEAAAETANSPRSWSEEKCVRYQSAWREALNRFGSDGLSAAFISDHDAFIGSGCTAPIKVCPQSTKEFELANILVIRAMNAGMASTFLPFACPRSRPE
jgi:hypothetical protein